MFATVDICLDRADRGLIALEILQGDPAWCQRASLTNSVATQVALLPKLMIFLPALLVTFLIGLFPTWPGEEGPREFAWKRLHRTDLQ